MPQTKFKIAIQTHPQSPGYRCDCPVGYNGDGRFACEPTDVRTVCASDFDCTNNAACVDGSTCVCRDGFEPQVRI